MPTYTFRVTSHNYFQVEAPLLAEALKTLEDCEDLAEYDVTQHCQTLDDLQPKFELVGITGKEEVWVGKP